MSLSKQAILSAPDLPMDTVYVKAWGGDVHVKALSIGAMAKAQAKVKNGSQLDLMVYVLIYGVTDENGKQLFTEKDAKHLFEKSQDPLVEVSNKIFELSGFGQSADEEKTEAGN